MTVKKYSANRIKRYLYKHNIKLVYAMRSLENISDAVYWINEKMEIIYVNEAACAELGYSREDLIGMNITQISGADDIQSVDDLIALSQLIKSGKSTAFESYHKHRDGHRIPVEMVCANIGIVGQEDIGISIVRDISKRIAFENELKETNNKLVVLNQELEKSAYLDHLTNVWNRRCLFQNLNSNLEFWKETDEKLSLLILDIDNFKEINDKYGHLAGDKVLVALVELIKSNIRDTDSITRWGGEEFLIVVPNLDISSAYRYAERLRQLVQDYSFLEVGTLTISIGVTEFNKADDFDSWIKRADDALYTAKNYRNRVEYC